MVDLILTKHISIRVTIDDYDDDQKRAIAQACEDRDEKVLAPLFTEEVKYATKFEECDYYGEFIDTAYEPCDDGHEQREMELSVV